MNVNEAFEILKSEGITKNIESVRRWIRNGELKAELRGKNRNSGYEIKEKDLEEFILSKLSPKEIEEYKKRKQTGAAENEFQKNYIRLQEIEKRLSEIKLDEHDVQTELVTTGEKYEKDGMTYTVMKPKAIKVSDKAKESHALKAEMREVVKAMQEHLDKRFKQFESR